MSNSMSNGMSNNKRNSMSNGMMSNGVLLRAKANGYTVPNIDQLDAKSCFSTIVEQ